MPTTGRPGTTLRQAETEKLRADIKSMKGFLIKELARADAGYEPLPGMDLEAARLILKTVLFPHIAQSEAAA